MTANAAMTEYGVWHIIDLGPDGPAGVEARVRVTGHPSHSPGHTHDIVHVWFNGSDHWRDWLHHVLPGSRRREIRAAQTIANRLAPHVGGDTLFIVGGHSLGGCLAEVETFILRALGERVYCRIYAGKRAPRSHVVDDGAVAYRRRGDIVPALPPWRPARRRRMPTAVFGSRTWPWRAHPPHQYKRQMEEAGFSW